MSKKEIFPGIHTVMALLRLHPERVRTIWAEQQKQNKRLDPIIQQAHQIGIAIHSVERKKLDQLCESTQHQGIAASCSPTPLVDEHELLMQVENNKSPLLLILDEVNDPHNLGACLRSADAVGVDAVILPQRHSAPLSPTVHKVASGATVRLPIVKATNLARCIDTLKKVGIWMMGADGDSPTSIYSADLTKPCAIVMGGEGQGLRRLTRERCDHLYALPMLGAVESLNVSVATGIFLYETIRQRNN